MSMKEGFDEGAREAPLRAIAGGETAAAEAVRGAKEKARTGLVGMEEPVWQGRPVRSFQPAVLVLRRGRPLLEWAAEKRMRGVGGDDDLEDEYRRRSSQSRRRVEEFAAAAPGGL